MTAAAAARAEAAEWAALAAGGWSVTEAAVVRFHDPRPDLERRARTWGYPLDAGDLADLARFAAALALTEAEAWEGDEPHLATRAYEDRRFLLGDRIAHWAVPWLDSSGATAHPDRDRLLGLGDRLRPAPAEQGGEGAYLPGHDAFGPIELPAPQAERLASLWSGLVLGGAPASPDRYRKAAAGWRDLAARHPGTAALWRDLAARADRTAGELAEGVRG